MLKRIIDFCFKEPLVVVCLFGAAFGYGWYALKNTAVDAIPNISQNQVIVYANWDGRSPKDVEDQITYPLSLALLAVPGAESVRGKSLFGYSFIQVTFKDDIDFYWARSRVAEQLSTATEALPPGVNPALGPDATGLGQIFYYVLQPDQPTNLTALRTLQDYVVKYALQSVDGVSEVASVGGYVKQYQIDVDPDRLRFHQIPLAQLTAALKAANSEVGAKTLEQSGMEFIVRGRGYLGGNLGEAQVVADIGESVVATREGVPIRVKDLGFVQSGTSFRRGALDLNGAEAVGGIVVMRFDENPLHVIAGIKAKIKQLEPALGGVKIVPVYDRTGLIEDTMATLSQALVHEILITIVVIILFIMHLRTSLIVALTLPAAVLLVFAAMRLYDLDANIMSLAGIAIAIGNMVDMGIVVSENIYQRLSDLYESRSKPEVTNSDRLRVIAAAVHEVAPALLTATATTVISFLPVFFLTGRDYKLFAPLAWTKTFALLAALVISISLTPILCRFFIKQKASDPRAAALLPWASAILGALGAYVIWGMPLAGLPAQLAVTVVGFGAGYLLGYFMARESLRSLSENPVSRMITDFYQPCLSWCLDHPRRALALPVVVLGIGLWSWSRLESDDWIALDEGSMFYMPTLYPGASFSQAMKTLQTQDALIKGIPEVAQVLGKIGRAQSALDPAPAGMIETIITLKPESEWRPGISRQDIWHEITARATLPGVTPAAFLQPIEGRVVMLQSGIKAAMAVRIYGDDLDQLGVATRAVAGFLKTKAVVNAATVNPDIVMGKPYAEFTVDRLSAARYGMTVEQINDAIETTIGGKLVGTTFEGRQRFAIRVRYYRELRDQLEGLEQIPIVTARGETIPLGVLAKVQTTWGPAVISSEDGRLVAHVAFAPSGEVGDLETVSQLEDALSAAQVAGDLSLPKGYELAIVGSFQNQIEANNRLLWLVPLVVLINLFIIVLQFKKVGLSLLVFAGIPVAFAGGMIWIWLLGVKINTAVWVGFIALFGISVDNGVLLMTYLLSYFKAEAPRSLASIKHGVMLASKRRVRPCLMTSVTTIMALLPVILAGGRGADVARGMALPIFGGMFVDLMALFVVPVVFASLMKRRMVAAA